MTDKARVATASLAGCFGCHMSVLDIDERLLELIQVVEFDRTPLTDIKTLGQCDSAIPFDAASTPGPVAERPA